MADLAALALRVDSTQVSAANENLARFERRAVSAERAAGHYEQRAGRAATASGRLAEQANRIVGVFRRLSGVLAAVGIGLSAGAIINYADAWSDMQSRVGAAIKNMEAAPVMMQRIVDIANASYSPLSQTVEVFSRNVMVLRDLGLGAAEAADYTEALNHGLVITATRGERAQQVQNALSKAMAVGKLQAEGLESVLAHGGRIAEALAKALGTNVNGLRAMSQQGKITSQVIATALIGSLDQLREEAAEMPATVGDAFTRLQTNMTAFIGQFDKATGLTQRLSDAIMFLADNLGTVTKAATVAGVAMLTYFAPSILASIRTGFVLIGRAGVAAFNAIRVAIVTNPIGALAIAFTTALTAAYLFRDEIKNIIGVDVIGVIKGTVNRGIGMFVGAYEAIKQAWGNLPTFFSAIGKQAWNNLIAEFEKPALTFGDTVIIPGLNLSGLKAELSEVEKLALKAAEITFNASLDTDYVGALAEFAGWTEKASAATFDLDGAMNKTVGTITKAQQKVRDLIKDLEFEIGLLGKSALQREIDTNLREAGAEATAKQRSAIERLTTTLFTMREAYETLGDVTRGFVTDFTNGLKEGEGVWRSFANAAVNAVDRIATRLVDLATDQLVNWLFRSLMGAFAGGVGGGFSGGMGIGMGTLSTLYAKGGAFNRGSPIAFAKGDIVDRPTLFPFSRGTGLMGEAGPEAIMPLRRGRDGRLGVDGGGAGGGRMQVDISVGVDKDGNIMPVVDARIDHNNRFVVPRIVHKQKNRSLVETGRT